MIISLHARFELLVKELAKNKDVSEEMKTALLTSGWENLFPDDKINQLFSELEKVEDAEKQF